MLLISLFILLADSGVPSNICIIIGSHQGRRLGTELGERRVHRDGQCVYWDVILGFCCLFP